MSIDNPYQSPQALAKPKSQSTVPPPASCGYTLAVILLGIVAGVMFTVAMFLVVVLIFQLVIERFF